MAKKLSSPAPVKTAGNAKASLASSGFDSINLVPDYAPVRQPAGKVVGVWGNALIRRASGEVEPIHVGDEVRKGDVILTTQDGIVQLEGPGMRLARLPGLVETDRALASTEEEFEAPAAGLTGGADGGLLGGLRLDRIVESVTGQNYDYDTAASRITPQAAGTNTDNGLPGLVINNISTPESAGFAVFAVQLSTALTVPTTVGLSLSSGSASAASATGGGDFGSTGANNLEVSLDGGTTWVSATTVVIPANQTTVLVRTPLVDDALNEAPETFTLTATPLSAGVAAASATGTATITDNDPQPTLSIDDVTVNEGAPNAVFTVSLSAPSGQTVTVTWTTINGAAGSDDFTTSSGTLTFQPGQTTQAILIPITNDTVFEKSETFNVQLGTAVNASITDGTGVGTILDDGTGTGGTNNDTPVATITGPAEVNEAAGTVTYTVTLSNLSSLPVSIPYSFRGVGDTPATFGTDVAATAGTLVIPANALTGTITVSVLEDKVYETAESYAVDLGTPTNATLANTSVTTRIVDGGNGVTPDGGTPSDDRPVVSAISSPSKAEGQPLDFDVTLSTTSTTDTTVTLNLTSGTGTLGTDTGAPVQVSFDGGTTWATLSGNTVTVPAGRSGFTVRVPTIDDAGDESNETVLLSASTAQNTAAVTGTGTIVDNDLTTVTLSGPTSVNEAAGTITYTVTLANATDVDVTVPYTFTSGTAAVGDDVQATNGSVIIRAGQTTGTFTAAIVEDVPYEGAEAYTVSLGTPTGALLGTTTSVTTTINDDGTGGMPNGGTPSDDRPAVASISSPSVSEGSNLDFVVTVNNTSTLPTTYTVAAQSGTGTVGADISTALQVSFDGGVTWSAISGGSVTVPANVTRFTVRVPTTEDAAVEGNETITLAVGSGTATGTIVNDDVAMTLDESALASGNLENALTQLASGSTSLAGSTSGAAYTFAADSATALNNAAYTSDGTAIVWTLSSDRTSLVGTVGPAGDGSNKVMTVTLDGSTGNASVQLTGPFDHTAANGASLSLAPVSVVNSLNAISDTRSLNITINDDTPVAQTQTRTVAQQDTNLLIVLDTSGSMSLIDGRASGESRLQIAVAAIKELIAQYDAVGDVRVTITTFSSESNGNVVSGATPAEALAALNNPTFQASGYTNYDAAIANAQTQWTAASASNLANGVNVSYFVSDGKPEGDSDTQTNAYKLDGAELTAWTDFLSANNMQSIAVGTGTQVTLSSSAADFLTALNAVAYDGRNGVDTSYANSGVLLAADAADLTAALQSTVPEAISGNLLGGSIDTASSAGADGGLVSSVTVGNTTYTYNGTTVTTGTVTLGSADTTNADGSKANFVNGELSITVAAGTVHIDLETGAYTFDATSTSPVTVNYQLTDGDGDTTGVTALTLQATLLTTIAGTLGADAALNGTAAANLIDGRGGNDTINAGAGNDHIYGGAGSDILTGGAGSDVFAWRLTDASTTIANAKDTITDFNKGAVGTGGDILDLRDLLQGEHAGNDLTGFLKFTTEAGTTTLHINSEGKLNSGGAEDQQIVLSGVDLTSFGNTDAQIIQNLLNQNKLVVDN